MPDELIEPGLPNFAGAVRPVSTPQFSSGAAPSNLTTKRTGLASFTGASTRCGSRLWNRNKIFPGAPRSREQPAFGGAMRRSECPPLWQYCIDDVKPCEYIRAATRSKCDKSRDAGHSKCAPRRIWSKWMSPHGHDLPRCVMSEDQVASFDRLVAGKAGFERRLFGRFAVLVKLSEPPAARRGVLFLSP